MSSPTQRLDTGASSADANYSSTSSGWVTKFVIGTTLLWFIAALIIMFSVLNIGSNWQSYQPMQWAGLVIMLIGPLAIIGVTVFAIRQLMMVTAQATQFQTLADHIVQPDMQIAERSATLANAIAQHVDDINAKLNEGVGRITELEKIVKSQSEAIDKSNKEAEASLQSMDGHIQSQKSAFESITTTYDERMGALSEMMDTHAENLAKATRVAEQKIKEARISVEGATERISSVSDVVRENTVQAATTLSGSHDEIKSLGDIIKQRSAELDEVYKKHANDLTAMIEHLREEQKHLGANMEDTLIRMRDLSLSAQASAESLSDASSAGKKTIEALAQSASLADNAVKTRFAEMEQMVRYSTEHAQNINTVASQRVQDSLEQTRTEIARIERDMAGLQDKLQRSELSSSAEPDMEIPDTRATLRKRKSRVHIKPIESPEDDVETTPVLEPVDKPSDDFEIPDENEAPSEDPSNLDLHIEPTRPEDVKPGMVSSDPILAAIRPVADYEASKKAKSGFSLRGLFGGRSDDDENASMSIAGPGPILSDNDGQRATTDRSFVLTLTEMGLSPNVIVDDGCVIEAANNRASQGHEAMSRSVINRLNVPVKHFAATLASDPDLSKRTIEFASEFDLKVENLANDREAIRTRLESENGRAYLICDAALNYGRV